MAYLAGKILDEVGRLRQDSLQAGCYGEYIASGAISFIGDAIEIGQMRRRRGGLIMKMVTQGFDSDGEVVTPCLELSRARQGTIFRVQHVY